MELNDCEEYIECFKKRGLNKSAFVCPFDGCKARFRRRDRFRYHVRQHKGLKFECVHENCDKHYASPSGLKRHLQRAHDSETITVTDKYNCSEVSCGKSFETSWGLKKHVTTAHAVKDYECNVCKKSFRKSRQLKIHEFEHTKVLPFKCVYENCGKAFLLPSKLKQHQKQHEGYTCDVDGCDEKFEKWSLYHNHKKLLHPRDFQCEVCCRLFKCKRSLKTHQVIHKEKREIFTCSYDGCPKFFYFEKNLKHHVSSTHEGKRHRCTHPECNKEFKHRVTLLHHLKLHSPKEPAQVMKVVNKNKTTKRRRDCGLRKKSAAALISGHQPEVDVDRKLIDQVVQSQPNKLEEARQMIDVVITINNNERGPS